MKYFKKLLVLTASLFMLVGCGEKTPTTPTVEDPSEPTVKPTEQPTTKTDVPVVNPTHGTDPVPGEFIDYVHTDEKIRLQHDYLDENGKNRDFFKEGISKVTLVYHIDGDTDHFRMVDSNDNTLIKSRYYGIDTPESTGTVEPYGGKASKFTKSKLEEAKTIVVTSTSLDEYIPPEPDSTGSRYLSMVWISNVENAPYNELYLLNLWIVQEGFSHLKNIAAYPSFQETFMAAEAQASREKLNIFSGLPDDDYNYGDYEDTSLLDLKREVAKNLDDKSYQNKYENKKVRIRGTVAGYTNNILYLQASFLDEDTGITEYAGINIFTGMTAIPSKYTFVNTFIQLCGLAQTSENFGFQITSVYSFPKASSKSENDTKVLYKADEIPEEFMIHTFQDDGGKIGQGNYEYLFSPVEFTEELTCTDGYDSTSTPAEITLKTKIGTQKTSFTIYIPFLYQPDPNDSLTKWRTYSDFVGHHFMLTGIYSFHYSMAGNLSFQFILRTSEDLVLVD